MIREGLAGRLRRVRRRRRRKYIISHCVYTLIYGYYVHSSRIILYI